MSHRRPKSVMTVRRWSRWPAGAGALAAVLILGTTDAPSPAGAPGAAGPPASARPSGPADTPGPADTSRPAATPASLPARATPGICTSSTQPALAAKLSRQIARALHGLSSTVGIAADDSKERLSCRYHQWRKFHSASVIKVITLCALLYELQEPQNLSPDQAELAQAMITESDNDAQDTLWNEVGMDALQRFLTAARMDHTWLGQDDYWGLTEVTAHDELRLLHLLINPNPVLDAPSRRYALGLMAEVAPDQRWGVPAGAPPDVTVHLKNGWLPDPDLWDVNSIGDFTRHDIDYSIAILTRDDPDMAYGVAVVETVARLINGALAEAAGEGADPGAMTSPQRFRNLVYMQRRFVR
jgi:beta-lactamase class A